MTAKSCKTKKLCNLQIMMLTEPIRSRINTGSALVLKVGGRTLDRGSQSDLERGGACVRLGRLHRVAFVPKTAQKQKREPLGGLLGITASFPVKGD